MSDGKLYFCICSALFFVAMVMLRRILNGMSEQFLDGLTVGVFTTVAAWVWSERWQKGRSQGR